MARKASKASIIKKIKATTSLSISALAKTNKFNRTLFYEAAAGHGSRHIRVYIATILNIPPSQLWPHRSAIIQERDDSAYGLHASVVSSSTKPNWSINK